MIARSPIRLSATISTAAQTDIACSIGMSMNLSASPSFWPSARRMCRKNPGTEKTYSTSTMFSTRMGAEAPNSDATVYGGSGVGNAGFADTTPIEGHGWYQSLNLTLPPLGALFLVPE